MCDCHSNDVCDHHHERILNVFRLMQEAQAANNLSAAANYRAALYLSGRKTDIVLGEDWDTAPAK